MKRHWRKWIFTCLGVVGILVLSLAFERIRGQGTLNNRLTVLRSQGEMLKIDDWELGMPCPEENAALALLALTN